MKVLAPSNLLRDAADVLAPLHDDVVVIGAAAVEVALAGRSRDSPCRSRSAGTVDP